MNILRVSVIVLGSEHQGSEENERQSTYTNVSEPKCCNVSKINNCPSAPVTLNSIKGDIIPGCCWTKVNAATSSDLPFPEGNKTGIDGRGNTISTKEMHVHIKLIQSIICCPEIL